MTYILKKCETSSHFGKFRRQVDELKIFNIEMIVFSFSTANLVAAIT